MQSVDIVTSIKQVFSEQDTTVLISALRQDEHVWNALQDTDLLMKLIQNVKRELTAWTPAAIFCLAESLPCPADLQNLSLGIEGVTRQQSIDFFEKIGRSGNNPKNLQEAGFAALALRERRKLVKSWDQLSDEIQNEEYGQGTGILDRWKTVISILSELVPDKEALFSELLSLPGKIGRDLVSHAVLSNPSPIKEKVNLLANLLFGLDLSAQIDWLQSLALRGELPLSEQLAKLLIANTTTNLLNGFLSTELSTLDLPQVAAKAVRLQHAATLFQLAGKEIEAERYLNSAIETLAYLNTGMRLQQSCIHPTLVSECEKTGQTVDPEVGDHSGLQGELLLSAAINGNKGTSKNFPGNFGRSYNDLRNAAKLAASGEIEKARDLARPSIDAFIRFIQNTSSDYSPKFLVNWQPEDFIDLLMTLDYLKEAAIAAEWFLRYQPTNARLLGLMGSLFSKNEQPEMAAKSLSLAVTLDPTSPDNRRLLARLHETNGRFADAVDEWMQVLDLSAEPPVEDKIQMAKAAIHAGQFENTYNICKSILEEDAFNGVAACYLGQAAGQMGKIDEASEQLQKSTLLAPDFAESWLAFARHQKQNGDVQKAYETLRSASYSLPDSSEINLELALMSMGTGRPSEALPHLRLAASLQPENLDVATMLVNALTVLGHKDEALEFLEKVRRNWPEEVNLARSHGLLLQEAGKYQDAVQPLSVVSRKDSGDEDAVVNLCLSLLESTLDHLVIDGKIKPNINLAEVAQIVSTLITKRPETIRGHLILGALQYSMGNLDDAFDEFKAAAELSAGKDNDTHWIAQGGLGKTALALNRPEVALAVLDEAAHDQPKNVTIQRLLVPTYLKANLPQEALITANHALELDPEDVDNLVWYAQTMLDIGNKDEAVKSIRKASDGLNASPKSLINLAALGMELNEQPSARKALYDLSTLPNVGSFDFARAAEIQMLLGDISSASDSLSRAIKLSNPVNTDWSFQLACLQKNMGDVAAAQETIRQTITSDPLSTESWLLQADLFEEQGRHQSALESLEKALSLINTKSPSASNEEKRLLHSVFSQYRNVSASEIHSRFSRLMYRLGNLTGALVHSEQALEIDPQNFQFRTQAARLAEAMLLTDRASSLASIPAEQKQILADEEISSEDKEAIAELLSMKAARLIFDQKLAEAEAIFQQICRVSPYGFYKENIEILLTAAIGNILDVKDKVDNHVVQHLLDSKKSKPSFLLSGISIAAMDAALSVERWDLAMKLAGQIVTEYPLEPAAHLAFCRALVRSAEDLQLRKDIGIQKHLPSGEIFSQALQDRFEVEILTAAKQTNSQEITIWQKRGLMVFGGKASLDQINPEELTQTSEQSAYLQALRLAGRPSDAVHSGEKFEETPQILLQISLAYADVNPRVGLDLCQHMLDSTPSNAVQFAASAKLAELSGEIGLAIDFLNDALQIYPDEPAWRSWLARLLSHQKDFDTAAIHMEEAVAMDPGSAENWESLGKLYSKSKQNDQAIHAFSKAIELAPQNPDTLLSLASSYRASGNIQDALDCIEKAIELNVKPEKPLLLRAEISRDLGNLSDAIKYTKEAIDIDPGNANAYQFLAQTQRIAGKANDAILTIEDALNNLGNNLDLLIEKAKILHSFRGANDVLSFLQKLASENPRNGEVMGMLAKVYAELGDLKNAESTALESLKVLPNQPDLNVFVGKILRKSGQLDKAAHHFSQAVDQSRMNLEAVLELAHTHQDQREYSKALEAFQLAIQIAPRDVNAYVGAASIYRESKDYSTAEEMLRRAAEIDPSNLTIRRQLGAVVALNLVHSSQEVKTLV